MLAGVKDIPLSEVDRVAKLVPTMPGTKLDDALRDVKEFQDVYNEAEYIKDLIDTARGMEGTVRNAGTHAAGVVITDLPITEYAALTRPTSQSGDIPIKSVIQYEMSIVDYMGLLKVDFLGLSTLTIMQQACKFIQERHNIDLHLMNIPVDDAESFEFLSQGHTAGVFQFEGTGMTRYIMQMKPKTLANLIAMVALYRPGPLQFIPSYIKRMHGEEEISYRHEKLKPVFEETYGIPIYQEQIMNAAVELAGYTAPEADNLRKAISKKKLKQIEMHRKKFIEGSVERDIPKEVAEKIFEDWEGFARYGFNKSHAAIYAVMAIQTAYLKTHFTVEYMNALMSVYKNDTDKVAFYVADCRSMGIDVLPPNINSSCWDFSIEDLPDERSAIRFGMGAIKNVGQGPVEIILEARKEGPFKDLNDFAKRVDLKTVGKRALESLIRVGALDEFGQRTALLESLDVILSVSGSHFKALQSGQMSFFGSVEGIEDNIELMLSVDLDQREMLEWEKELLGLYVSDHPLTPYMPILKKKVSHFSGQLGEARHEQKVTVAGIIVRFRPYQTKKGKPMGFATIEDIQGNIDLVIFPSAWKKYRELVQVDQVVIVKGKVDADNNEPKILVDSLESLDLDELPQDNGQEFHDSYMEDTLPEEEEEEEEEDFSSPFPGEIVNNEPPEAEKAQPVETVKNTQPSQKVIRETPANNYQEDWNDGLPPQPEPPAEWETFTPAAKTTYQAAPPMPQEVSPAEYEEPRNDPKAQKPAADPKTNIPKAGLQANPEIIDPGIKPGTLPENILPISYLISPSQNQTFTDKQKSEIQMVTVVLRSCGNKDRDTRRLVRIHGQLHSCPGRDRFALLIFEKGHYYLIEFPNETTGVSQELLRKLGEIVGEENVRIEPLKIH